MVLSARGMAYANSKNSWPLAGFWPRRFLGWSLAHLVFCPGAERRRAAHWDKAGPSLAVREPADVVPVGGAVPSRDVLTDRVARAPQHAEG